MRFDWKDLALWCFCSFYFGMIFGPVFFLNADVLKWGSACGAALAATLAVAGFLLNVSNNRLRAQLADREEFRRVWAIFGRGAVVVRQLRYLKTRAETIIQHYTENKRPSLEALQFIFDVKPYNIEIDDDPLTHYLVQLTWSQRDILEQHYNESDARDRLLTDDEITGLKSLTRSIETSRESVTSDVIEPLVAYLTSRKVAIRRTDKGDFVPHRIVPSHD